MGQSFIGSGYVQNILNAEVNEFLHRTREPAKPLVALQTRVRFNPNLTGFWFGGVMETINNITLLTIVLVGAAFIREREHGTIEHLLVMPLTPFEIMMAKVWANALVVLVASAFALAVIVERVMQVPLAGSLPLFLLCALLYLFAAASLGIFLGTVARFDAPAGPADHPVDHSARTALGRRHAAREHARAGAGLMLAAPTTWFVSSAQAILYRGAGFAVVGPDMLAIAAIGSVFFAIALARFRHSVSQTQL